MPRRGLTGERLVALFLIGVLLFTQPVIGLFDKATLVGGIPVLYLYLYLAWGALIALVALVVDRAEPDEDVAQGQLGPDLDQRRP